MSYREVTPHHLGPARGGHPSPTPDEGVSKMLPSLVECDALASWQPAAGRGASTEVVADLIVAHPHHASAIFGMAADHLGVVCALLREHRRPSQFVERVVGQQYTINGRQMYLLLRQGVPERIIERVFKLHYGTAQACVASMTLAEYRHVVSSGMMRVHFCDHTKAALHELLVVPDRRCVLDNAEEIYRRLVSGAASPADLRSHVGVLERIGVCPRGLTLLRYVLDVLEDRPTTAPAVDALGTGLRMDPVVKSLARFFTLDDYPRYLKHAGVLRALAFHARSVPDEVQVCYALDKATSPDGLLRPMSTVCDLPLSRVLPILRQLHAAHPRASGMARLVRHVVERLPDANGPAVVPTARLLLEMGRVLPASPSANVGERGYHYRIARWVATYQVHGASALNAQARKLAMHEKVALFAHRVAIPRVWTPAVRTAYAESPRGRRVEGARQALYDARAGHDGRLFLPGVLVQVVLEYAFAVVPSEAFLRGVANHVSRTPVRGAPGGSDSGAPAPKKHRAGNS